MCLVRVCVDLVSWCVFVFCWFVLACELCFVLLSFLVCLSAVSCFCLCWGPLVFIDSNVFLSIVLRGCFFASFVY